MKNNKFIFLALLAILSGCREIVVHDLGEADANKMLTHLVAIELHPKKEKQPDGKWSLSLPSEQASRAIQYLTENRLVKEEASKLPDKGGLMLSREEQRFRYERLLSREIENTLSGVGAVLQARVHLNLPIIDPLFGQNVDNSKSSASVLLVVGKSNVDKSEVSALVAGASGIPASAISVTISNGIPNSEQEQLVNSPGNKTSNSQPLYSGSPKPKESEGTLNLSTVFDIPNSILSSLPWALISFVVAVALMILMVLRNLHRNERLPM